MKEENQSSDEKDKDAIEPMETDGTAPQKTPSEEEGEKKNDDNGEKMETEGEMKNDGVKQEAKVDEERLTLLIDGQELFKISQRFAQHLKQSKNSLIPKTVQGRGSFYCARSVIFNRHGAL